MADVTLASYRAAYEHATELAKSVQAFRDAAVVPAANELRYAGHHLLLAIDDKGCLVDQDQLVKARNHCRRAAYDAVEAGLSHALRQIKKFKEDYRTVQITPVVRNWMEILADTETAQEILGQARPEPENHQTDDHRRHLEQFEKLLPHVKILSYAREELNKSAKESASDGRRFVITALLALLGIVVTVAGIVFAS